MHNLERRFIFLLCLLLPVQLSYHFWPDFSLIFGVRVDYLSPTIYLTDLLIVAIVFLHLYNRKSQRFYPNLLLIGVFLFAIVNSYYAYIEPLAIVRWLRLVEYLLLGWVIVNQRKSINLHIPLAIAALYTFLIAAVQFLIQRNIGGIMRYLGERPLAADSANMAIINFWGNDFLRPYATFPHPNVLGAFGLVVLLMLLTVVRKTSLIKWGIVSASGIIVLSFSQAIWVATLLMFFVLPLKRTILQKSLYVLLVVATVVSLGLVFIKPQFNSFAVDSRIALARTAGYLFNESPVIGHGLGNFVPVNQINILNLLVARDARLRFQPVHNVPLLLLTEVGVIGFMIVVVGVLRFIKRASNIGLIGLFIILVTGVVDHYWLTLHQGTLLLVLILVQLTRYETNSKH